MIVPTNFVLTGGRLIDPTLGTDGSGWVHVRDGRIANLGDQAQPLPVDVPVIDVGDRIIAPGLIDLHVHLREPGAEHKETIASGARSAVAGGFTAVCCMPNTTPAIDSVATLNHILQRAAEANLCRVHVIAAATLGRQGRDVVDYQALVDAGAVAFSDDGDGVEDDAVCRAVLSGIAQVGSVFFPHCEFKALSRRGLMHLGHVSERLGLVGYDPRGEEAMIERDLGLVTEIGTRYHVAHVSTARGVELIRGAKAKGLPVTTEVCPHHLLLCDEDVVGIDGRPDVNRKMSPPLRSPDDVAACVAGVRSGVIDAIVTDHAPHADAEKALGFKAAPMGVVGLETSLACAAEALLKPGQLDWLDLIERMSTAPARILNLPGGTLKPGSPADITIIDPKLEWTVDPAGFHSKSRNSAFIGWCLPAKCVATFVGGQPVYWDEAVMPASSVAP